MTERLVLYRKYRPQSFREVVGQEHVVKTLKNALLLGRVSHAYLFAGPRGTGKTTVARILARAVNCSSPKDGEPDNRCEHCLEFQAGRAIDLVEIDAASNRGIDEIRALREGIGFLPVKAPKKVFIIDEVHMLTKEAFNALLKTLEEPPAHALFVLATTEPAKVPLTILSRVQRFDFRRLTVPEITEELSRVMKAEKVSAEPAAVALLASHAEGSLRDAESRLEQVISVGENPIRKEQVQATFGLLDAEKIRRVVAALAKKDAGETMSLLQRIQEEGHDPHEFARALTRYVRKLLLTRVNPNVTAYFASEFSPEDLETLKTQATSFHLPELSKLTQLLLAAEFEMKRTPIPMLPIEIALVQFLSSE